MIELEKITEIANAAEARGDDGLAVLLFTVSDSIRALHEDSARIDSMLGRLDTMGVSEDALEALGRLDEKIEDYADALTAAVNGKGEPCDARR